MPKHTLPDLSTIDPATVPSAVLRRLIAEVQQEALPVPSLYDRIHNRHNRGGGSPWPPRPVPAPSPEPPAPPEPPEEGTPDTGATP